MKLLIHKPLFCHTESAHRTKLSFFIYQLITDLHKNCIPKTHHAKKQLTASAGKPGSPSYAVGEPIDLQAEIEGSLGKKSFEHFQLVWSN